MAPVIFGLNLGEFTWSKFGNKNMWNKFYYLRRTKFVIYQCALIFCVLSESLGTAALSDYVDEQKYIRGLNSEAYEYNNDYIGIASYNIFAGVFVAFVFGAAYFFDLIWPERHEDRGIRVAWKICAVVATVFYFAAALAMTIIVAIRSAYISGVSSEEAQRLLDAYNGSPLIYRHNGRAIASVVFSWLGTVSTAASAVILIKAKNHDEKYGPWSTHTREAMKTDPEANMTMDGEKVAPPPVGPQPAQVASELFPEEEKDKSKKGTTQEAPAPAQRNQGNVEMSEAGRPVSATT